MNASELIAEYSRTRSDSAFGTLVERYIRLVHSACWRQLRDAQLAEDATQQVFVLLSQKAKSLRHDDLPGWLLTTARFVCANMNRSETRRVRREQVVAMNSAETASQSNMELLQMLDEGLLRMRDEDRKALVLRFLQEQPLRQVGESLGLSEDAARKRVDRGLDKLRQFFADRGIQTDSAALAIVLADHSHVSPIGGGLAQKIVAAARSAPVAPTAALSPQVMVAAAVVMTVILGAGGWAAFKWSSQPRVADNIVVAQADPAPAPVLPPTTLPAMDLSTPENTLAALGKALEAADRDAVYACMLTDPNRQPKLIDVALDGGLANQRMVLAAKKAFGDDGAKLSTDDVSFSTILKSVLVLHRLNGETADISGNSASMTVQIPAAIVQSVPADFQEILLMWSGKKVYFELREGAWRIDMDRSIQFVVKLKKRGSSSVIKASDATAIAIIGAQAKGWNSIASRISEGKLMNLQEALSARQQVWNQIYDNFGLAQLSTYSAPVIPEKP
jgi:RNA polymerase sigma factor (sigma-70 family)